MQSLVERDYFTDYEILKEPYAFFDALRAHGPIYRPPGKDYYVVTGFEEALEVLRNHDVFSAAIALQGAGAPLPFAPHGSDITGQIEAHRRQFPGGDRVVKIELDPEFHPNGAADLSYEASFIIRGLATMHLKLTPSEKFATA